MGKRELIALLNVSSWCPVMVEWLFLAVLWGCLQFVIVVFPDHTHLLFFIDSRISFYCNNLDLLSPKPKFTFRNLMKGVQEFHRKFVLEPADKAAYNVVGVRYTTLTP